MDLSYVKKLMKMLSDSDIDEIEIEEEGKKIRLVKHSPNSNAIQSGVPSLQVPLYAAPTASSLPQTAAQSQPTETATQAPPSKTAFHEIKSPIVGTFYAAPAPDAAPFVEAGSMISPGTVLCIVEAMKLMNEIESDVSGKIVKVMVTNGKAVEYGQTLFLVEQM